MGSHRPLSYVMESETCICKGCMIIVLFYYILNTDLM
jgi:hypothetical protein